MSPPRKNSSLGSISCICKGMLNKREAIFIEINASIFYFSFSGFTFHLIFSFLRLGLLFPLFRQTQKPILHHVLVSSIFHVLRDFRPFFAMDRGQSEEFFIFLLNPFTFVNFLCQVMLPSRFALFRANKVSSLRLKKYFFTDLCPFSFFFPFNYPFEVFIIFFAPMILFFTFGQD